MKACTYGGGSGVGEGVIDLRKVEEVQWGTGRGDGCAGIWLGVGDSSRAHTVYMTYTC